MNRQTDVRLSLWAVCPVRWCCYKRIHVVYSEDLEKFVHNKKSRRSPRSKARRPPAWGVKDLMPLEQRANGFGRAGLACGEVNERTDRCPRLSLALGCM